MTARASEVLDATLNDGGFLHNGEPVAGLMGADSSRATLQQDLRYSEVLATSSGQPTVDLVYESPSGIPGISGDPCIYFKSLEEPTMEEIVRLRSRVWNHGRVPTLWIITPRSVRFYDAFARPKLGDDSDSHLLEELEYIGSHVEGLDAFHKRQFDSRAFWRSKYAKKIDRDEKVDIALLTDLRQTEHLLRNLNLAPSLVHALLGRSIFVSYLRDRGILSRDFFRREFQADSFVGLLDDKKTTYRFFEWLGDAFNGDLFPLEKNEMDAVEEYHLSIIKAFLSGVDMRTYPANQARLWPYAFDTIPIELISSVYEVFVHSSSKQHAKASSVYYTRPGLVELTLDLAFRGLSHTARILDPACGSGVFLVDSFRRLVWLKSQALGRRLERDELREVLVSQIYGIDIDKDAIQVAAFSLYLALLELDPHPEPPENLRFPRLTPSGRLDGRGANLYVQNFLASENGFNTNPVFTQKKFDLIVGNPPWTALKRTSKVDRTDSSIMADDLHQSFEFIEQQGIPDAKPDQAFLRRARDFSTHHTKVAFVIATRLFSQVSGTAKLFRDRFLTENTLHEVVNLSDLADDNLLFGRVSAQSSLPASVVVFTPRRPVQTTSIRYITPKRYPGIRSRDQIVVTAADVQQLPQQLAKEKNFVWKAAFRGGARAFRLVDRLQGYPTLEGILNTLQIRNKSDRGYGISVKGRGQKDASALVGFPFLRSTIRTRYEIDPLNLDPFPHSSLYRSNSRRLPALILFRSLVEGRPSTALVQPRAGIDNLVIGHTYYGISLPDQFLDIGRRLNAVLNSTMVSYLAFMSGSQLGWSRSWRLVEVTDWMGMRLPPSTIGSAEPEVWSRLLKHEEWLRSSRSRDRSSPLAIKTSEVEAIVDEIVYDLYALSPQERILVKETMQYTIRPFFSRDGAESLHSIEEPSIDQLLTYASRLQSQLNGILQYGEGLLSCTVWDVDSAPLRACRFSVDRTGQLPPIQFARSRTVDEVLNEMGPALREEISKHLTVQFDLRAYDEGVFWIIKPAERRLWTESAALEDADAIVREHMGASPR